MRSLTSPLLLLFPLLLQTRDAQSQRRFIQIWFRHGERTPTKLTRFPSDPPDLGKDFPVKPGELTRRGIQQEFGLGQRLRVEYGAFLGDYDRDEIRVLAGEDNRTIASGLAVLAGLYPPRSQLPIDGLNWQPIPIHSRLTLDEVSTGVLDYCDGLEKAIRSSSQFTEILKSIDGETLTYVREKTGLPIKDANEFNYVVDSIKTKRALNDSRLPLPEWSFPLLPLINNLSDHVHTKMVAMLNESAGGYHGELILSAIEDHFALPSRKALFFSGHDTNLMTIGAFFDIPDLSTRLCDYAAHLAIELHDHPTDQFIIKIFYARSLNATREELVIPGCGSPCSLTNLQMITREKRWSEGRWLEMCGRGEDALGEVTASNGLLTGSLLLAVALLVVTSLFLLYTTFYYKRRLQSTRQSESSLLLK